MTHNMSVHELILQAVQCLPQMKNKRLLHLSIVGSRSKHLASHDSDYDLKAIVLHSKEDYLLQSVTSSKSFTLTSIIDPDTGDSVEADGTLIDYLTMQSYALKSQHAAHDALLGIPLYQTKESLYLKRLYDRAYNPRALLCNFRGILRDSRRKVTKKFGTDGCVKLASNAAYFASAALVTSRRSSYGNPPPHDAFSLLEQLDDIDSDLRQQIKSLYEQKKVDRSRSDFTFSTKLLEFIECDGKQLALEAIRPVRPSEEIHALKEKANETFLKLILSL